MRRSVLAFSALMVALCVVAVGCGSKVSSGSSGGTSGGSGSGSQPYYIEKPYPTIVPTSPNEKKAVAGVAQALKGYIASAEAGNKQNKRDDSIFDNKQGYKPRFVGYEFSVFTSKAADGKYRSLDVAAFDGATQVKPFSVWDRFGSADKGSGLMNDSYYAGVSLTSDPSAFTRAITPVSDGEKAAQAAVEAWAKKNLDPAFDKIALAGYLFEYGERTDAPNMMMSVSPDGFSSGSVINWGPTK